jgi:phosphopantothenoylcysteine decarboxylase/phosphopantothenate--cysteine ligase
MYDACMKNSEDKDIIVMSAAVADYKPEFVGSEKMSKKNKTLILSLVPTQDILAELGKRKKNGQLLVGFALETNDALENAKEKLRQKNLDLIVLNSLKDEGAGFEHNTNKVSIINREMKINEYPLKSKTEAAKDIVNAILELVIKYSKKENKTKELHI